jgi:LysM repeat protein|tara:strand:+ start:421 stop:1191 length:771 start_codon:yes stop_codon:yes gene_type:complete
MAFKMRSGNGPLKFKNIGSSPMKQIDYEIQRGDNLTRIARANNTTVQALMDANPQIKNKNLIYAGNTLTIPESKTLLAEDFIPEVVTEEPLVGDNIAPEPGSTEEADQANIESTTSVYEDKMGEINEKFDKKRKIAELQDRPRKVQRLINRQLRKLEKQSDKAEVDVARAEKENIIANHNEKIEDIKFEKSEYIQELKDGGASRQQIRKAKKDYKDRINKAKDLRKWDKREANKMVQENRRDARESTTWTEDMIDA